MGPWSKLDDFCKRAATSPIIEIDAKSITTLKDAQTALDKSGFTPDRLVIFGWEILLSRRKQDGIVRWHLSAKLLPHARASTEDDWKILGRIAARVGAPQDPTIMPDDPRAAIHWSWIAEPS